jgi:hypothetical protein
MMNDGFNMDWCSLNDLLMIEWVMTAGFGWLDYGWMINNIWLRVYERWTMDERLMDDGWKVDVYKSMVDGGLINVESMFIEW